MSLFMVACTAKPVEDCMAIEFDNSRHDYIWFNNFTLEKPNLEQITGCAWIYPSHLISSQYYSNVLGSYIYNDDTIVSGYFAFTIHQNTEVGGNGLMYFSAYKWNTSGTWYVNNAVTMDTWNHICFTYDASSVNNNPLLYWNGISQAVIETSAPQTEKTYTKYRHIVMSNSSGVQSINGLIQDVRIYNRILSANEIETLANSKCLKTVMNGLVFWAPMWGTNDQSFDGLTLTSSHRITDWINGATGTPYESPIGRGNTIQPLK